MPDPFETGPVLYQIHPVYMDGTGLKNIMRKRTAKSERLTLGQPGTNEMVSNYSHESVTFFILYRSSPDLLSGQISNEFGSGVFRASARPIRTLLVPVPNGSSIV